MSLETCPVCKEKFVPIWENKEIKCKKCKSKIKIKNMSEIEQEQLQNWNKSDLIELIDSITSRIKSISKHQRELENRIETLGIIVEQTV